MSTQEPRTTRPSRGYHPRRARSRAVKGWLAGILIAGGVVTGTATFWAFNPASGEQLVTAGPSPIETSVEPNQTAAISATSAATISPTPSTVASSTTPSTTRPPGTVAPGTFPQPGQVGFRGNTGSLKVVNGSGSAPSGTRWDSTAGALRVEGNVTLDGVFVKGSVTYAGGGTLTVRNSIIEGAAPSWAALMANGGKIDVRDTTLRWRKGSVPGSKWGNGVIHGDAVMTIIRCDISGAPDGVQLGGEGSLLEQNYIHDLAMLGAYPTGTHNDGIQSYGGDNLIVRYNRIDLVVNGLAYDGNHQNGAVFVQPGGPEPCRNLQVIGNYLAGGGYTLRLEGPMRDAVVVGNRFGPTTGGWGVVTKEADVTIARWENNLNVQGRAVPKP